MSSLVLLETSWPIPTRISAPALTPNVTDPVVSCCWLRPPASKHVPHPDTFCTVDPDADAFTTSAHVTAVAPVLVPPDVDVPLDVDDPPDEPEVAVIWAFCTAAPMV